MAVIIHRLRLGYKACWQIVERVARECNYCDRSPDEPLVHYLLECPETISLRTNINIPNVQGPDSYITAARVAKNIIEDLDTHGDLIIEKPPPR